eukprot:CAMPEP_0194226840 /NCGR_PEP_ID=MMETSP0156-20130528/42551_1 /TAXON_ID=33649 /ORGANISM="Thalassionema nitzschioides, Strain L26-B" /LENGTH=203 /DNA_ID=CAMNT_0038959303 /DNA_START=78 /DNA_END=689 /DNA_ORIENTATION=-
MKLSLSYSILAVALALVSADNTDDVSRNLPEAPVPVPVYVGKKGGYSSGYSGKKGGYSGKKGYTPAAVPVSLGKAGEGGKGESDNIIIPLPSYGGKKGGYSGSGKKGGYSGKKGYAPATVPVSLGKAGEGGKGDNIIIPLPSYGGKKGGYGGKKGGKKGYSGGYDDGACCICSRAEVDGRASIFNCECDCDDDDDGDDDVGDE